MNVKPTLYQRIHKTFILVPLIIVMTATAVTAASVTVRWDPNVPSPKGYRVFARTSGQAYNYNRPDWQGSKSACTFDRLDDWTEYYFVVRAYQGSMESVDSAEVHDVPPGYPNGHTMTDDDDDGLPDEWEAHFGMDRLRDDTDDDLDGDGISNRDEFRAGLEPDDRERDAFQAEIARSVSSPSANCEPTHLVAASEDTILGIKQVTLMDPFDLEIDETAPDQLPAAMVAYKLVVHHPGQRALVAIHLSNQAPVGATWVKYDAVNGWQDYSQFAKISADRRSAVI